MDGQVRICISGYFCNWPPSGILSDRIQSLDNSIDLALVVLCTSQVLAGNRAESMIIRQRLLERAA
jgi:hypothetical protein